MSKKIAFLSTFYPYRGGIAQFNASLYRAFEELGNPTEAYTFKRQYPEILFPGSSQFASETDSSDKIPAKRVLDTINPITYLSTAKEIAKFQPDILLMKYWMPFFAPGLGTVARKLRKKGTKVIPILDNVIPHEKRIGDTQLNKYFLNSADGFVAMSSSVKQDLLSLKPDAKTLFHPHPLYSHFGDKLDKTEAQWKLNIPPNKKVLLFFGLIRAYKGLDLLIEAFGKLSDEYFLLIAGESYEDFSRYEEMIARNPNKERIQTHARYIADEEVPLLFSASDVSVLPYKTATQSGVVSIAFHFNLPVIVTNVGSLKEMVDTYEGGLVIEKPNAQQIRVGVEQFFETDLQTSVPESIEAQKAKYDWSQLAKSILKFSEEI
ncbi:MAG: glycosyltransferase involved in cell wall biosynthesis [Flammeovirgaceae bacterium]|jgi:glycosyltransferase involved in cell wall biosynthesis